MPNNKMKVWVNNSFEGHYPVGTGAVVVAESAIMAAEVLNAELINRFLPESANPEQFTQLLVTECIAVILCDGDY